MTAQTKDLEVTEDAVEKPAKRAYPGATLRHLGSVRDVTLAKTNGPNEPFGSRRRIA